VLLRDPPHQGEEDGEHDRELPGYQRHGERELRQGCHQDAQRKTHRQETDQSVCLALEPCPFLAQGLERSTDAPHLRVRAYRDDAAYARAR
jgi:hypothetical protein